MTTTPKLLKDRIFAEVLPIKEPESGIILGEADLDRHRCKVLAVGPEVEVVKVGQVLRFDHNTAVPYEEGSKKFVFLRERDTIFILSDGDHPRHILVDK